MKTEVNKDGLRKWVVALRSKEYKQGQHSLGSVTNGETRYCCLGVACEIFYKDLGIRRYIHEYEEDTYSIQFDDHDGALPEDLAHLLGIDPNPIVGIKEISGKEVTLSATDANDIYRLRFDEIADLIEEYYNLKD